MNIWIWVSIWAAILAATGIFYFQIFTTLQGKAKRLFGQLEILLNTIESLQAEVEKKATFTAEPSAIETGEGIALAERKKLVRQRSKAKEERSRRLIKGLKNLQKENQ